MPIATESDHAECRLILTNHHEMLMETEKWALTRVMSSFVRQEEYPASDFETAAQAIARVVARCSNRSPWE